MRKINYAIIILLLVGLNSCDEDNKTVKYKSNDFVGDWNIISVFYNYEIPDKELGLVIKNDTLSLNMDGTASVRQNLYRRDGTLDSYFRSGIGTWNYISDSNYINVDINTILYYQEEKILDEQKYLVFGYIKNLTPKLVVQNYIKHTYSNYSTTTELVKIN